jgi:hypothetical protein
MTILTNSGTRRLGVPGRPALIIDAGQGISVTDEQLEVIKKSSTAARWLESGVLTLSDKSVEAEHTLKKVAPQPKSKRKPVDRDKREEVKLPEGITGDGVEKYHAGGGWWKVYVNGFEVTDRTVRKDEAASIAAEYD